MNLTKRTETRQNICYWFKMPVCVDGYIFVQTIHI